MNDTCKGIILVGGPSKGTRLRPLSFDMPKPLFPVGGVEMIGHHIYALSKIPNLSEIILIGFYEAASFQTFIQTVEENFNIPCKYFQEEKKGQGTAGGLFQFKDKIFDSHTSNIILLHCDICCHFPLVEMLQFHTSHKKICTIMSVEVSPEESKNYGCFVKDANTNELIHYAEKPETNISNLINCGIYIFTKDLFEQLKAANEHKKEETPEILNEKAAKWKNFFKLNIGNSSSLSLEKDVIMPLVSNKQVLLYQIENQGKGSFWFQIKSAGCVLKASFRYLEYYETTDQGIFTRVNEVKALSAGKVLIHQSAEVDKSAKIGQNVIIGSGVKIGAGVRIVNSIILDGVEIMAHSYIANSIIGWNSVIGRWARIVGIPSLDKTNEQNEGVSILGVGVTVEPEIFLSNCLVLPYKNLSENHHGEIIL